MKFYPIPNSFRMKPISLSLRLGLVLVLVLLSGSAGLSPQYTWALISVAEKNARDAQLKKNSPPSDTPASPLTPTTPAQPARFKVVLDPGHGGIDNGTSYKGSPPVTEKDMTLILAREVAAELRVRGIEVIMTRDGDYEMSLAGRTALANQVGADLFLSIHLNSTTQGMNPALAQGIETYILNHESDSTSKRLAELENKVIGGVDAQHEDVALILKDLRLDASLAESKRLACMIQSQVAHKILSPSRSKKKADVTVNRGVRQALFFVLLGADMPSALIEAGFLSNARDRDWLLSRPGQKSFGLAVARAIGLFRKQKNTPEARRVLSSCKVH